MERDPIPDALFVANNLMAVGALQALTDLGMRIPEDLGFASFDELPWSPGTQRSLFVVTQPAYDMGRLSADLLMSRIDGDEGPVRHVVLDPVLRGGSGDAWSTDAVRRWTTIGDGPADERRPDADARQQAGSAGAPA